MADVAFSLYVTLFRPISPPKFALISLGIWTTSDTHVKTAEPIDLPFGMVSGMDARYCAADGHAHWRHLANVVEHSCMAAMSGSATPGGGAESRSRVPAPSEFSLRIYEEPRASNDSNKLFFSLFRNK